MTADRRAAWAPQARSRELVVKTVAGEVLVYDLARHRAHRLNVAAAAVWRACDGTRTLAEIAMRATSDSGLTLDGAAVGYALTQLDRAHLLAEPGLPADTHPRMTRRDLIRRGATLATIPLVASVLVPTAARAASPTGSCLQESSKCSSNDQCCSGNCFGGACQPCFPSSSGSCTANSQCCSLNCHFVSNVCQGCVPNSRPCSLSSDCCSGCCNTTTNLCQAPGSLVENGGSCGSNSECCSNFCHVAGVCQDPP